METLIEHGRRTIGQGYLLAIAFMLLFVVFFFLLFPKKKIRSGLESAEGKVDSAHTQKWD